MAEEQQETQEYTVVLNGIEHTMMLDEETAKRYGDQATKMGKASTKAKTPANKAKG